MNYASLYNYYVTFLPQRATKLRCFFAGYQQKKIHIKPTNQ